MARLINTVVTQQDACKVVTTYNNGSTSEKVLAVDNIETIRYVDNKEIKTITGRISDVYISVEKGSQVAGDDFNKNASVKIVTVDSSSEYHAEFTEVNAREIIEDEGVVDVRRVDAYPYLIVNLDMYYSDNTIVNQSLEVGDTLENVVIMPVKPGGEDITGDFVVTGFGYNKINGRPVANAVALKKANEDTTESVMYPFNRLVSFFEIRVVPDVDSVDALKDALAEGGTAIVSLASDINLDGQTLAIPEGSDVTLNLNGHTISDENDTVLLLNSGNLSLVGGEFNGKGVVNEGVLQINGTKLVSNDTANAALINQEGGHVTVYEGDFSVTHVGSASDPKGCACIRNHGDMVVKNVTCTSPSLRTYAIISDGTIVIEDGNVVLDGAHGALAIDAGTAEIYGGTYTSTEFYGIYVSNDGTGEDPEKAAVTVYGGTYTGKTTSAYVGSDVNDPVNSTLDILGGTFNNKLTVQRNVEESAGIRLYGGKFIEKMADKYLAEGYAYTEEPDEQGYYEVLAIN